jgi:hypothetical protein
MAPEVDLALVLKARDLASHEVGKLRGELDATKKSGGGLSGALGTLAKVGIAGAVGAGIALVGVLGESIKAAVDDQKNIAKLDTALRTNVKGYKGNEEAIDALMVKREALAFSEDDQRASLAQLVTKYHDVNEAEKIQGVAMDVARLKGISLADATTLVSKGMDGSAKVLKQLGIVLPKTATEQDRLTAIQKKAAGQAAAYGKTAAGSQEAFNVALHDVSAELGGMFLPILTAFFHFLVANVLPVVHQVVEAIKKWVSENQPLINQIMKLYTDYLKNLVGVISTLVGWLLSVFHTLSTNHAVLTVVGVTFHVIATAIGLVVSALQQLFGWAGKAIDILSHIHMPNINLPDWFPHFAAGGIVPGPIGAPQLVIAHGGERVQRPGGQDKITSAGGVTIQGVTEQDILDMVDRGLYFRLRRTPAGIGV